MSILTEALPDAVEIDGQVWPINTDFRVALRVILAFEDPDLTGIEKTSVMLDNLYPEQPGNVAEAVRLGMLFLDGGETSDAPNGPRLFSFEKDADLIFSAFYQTHGVDLETANLHWWKFLALFRDLGADTVFCNLVGLRKRVKTGKATKEERRIARELGEAFTIDDRTQQERDFEAEFLRLVEEGNHRRAQA